MKSRVILVGTLAILLLPILAGGTQNSPQPQESILGLDRDLVEKGVIALVAAMLAFAGNYALAVIKRRSEPQKELSFDTEVSGGLVTIEDSVRQRIKVEYQGREVDNLYHIRCSVENSGNSVVRDQYIRFEVVGGGDPVDYYIDPKPEPELQVAEAPMEPQGAIGKRYRLGHIERRQRVVFHFITTGPNAPTLKLHPFNAEGGVDLVPRSLSVAAGQAQEVSTFLALYLLFILIPPILRALPYGLGNLPSIVVMLVLVLLMVPRLAAISKLGAEILQRWAKWEPTRSINVTAQEIQAESLEIRND